MKKYLYLLIFASILFITNNVYAESVTYGFKQCKTESSDSEDRFENRWSTSGRCRDGEYKNAFIINYNGNGKMDATFYSIAFDAYAAQNEVIDVSLTSEYRYEKNINGNFIHYDMKYLGEYYKKSNKIPDDIVVIKTNDGSGIIYYFGASDLQSLPMKDGDNYSVFYFSSKQELTEANSCVDLEYDILQLEEFAKLYGSDGDKTVAYAEEMSKKCDKYLVYAQDRSNSCYSLCRDMKDIIANTGVDIFNETNECGLGKKMAAWLVRIFKLLRYIVPIIVIVLSTFEYINAILSAEDDAMRKVGGRFGKRLFIMILFFVIPALLQFVFNIFNVDGLSSSNPYCLK